MNNLRPCPFCGAEPTMQNTHTPYVKCLNCLGDGPRCAKEEIAADEWNTRPIEDALTAELAELRAQIGRPAEAIYGEYHDMRVKVDELEALLQQRDLDLSFAKMHLDQLKWHDAMTEKIPEDNWSCIRIVNDKLMWCHLPPEPEGDQPNG